MINIKKSFSTESLLGIKKKIIGSVIFKKSKSEELLVPSGLIQTNYLGFLVNYFGKFPKGLFGYSIDWLKVFIIKIN
jgi:hypothetical protein